MREALNLALDQAMERDDRVFLLGEDIADPGASGPDRRTCRRSTATTGCSTRRSRRRRSSAPRSALAMEGLRPVAEIMIMDFIGIAADQLINHAAKMRFMTAGRTTAPITVRTAVYGGIGTGATHSQSLEGWFMHIPGMKVIVPSTPRDGKGLLTTAIFDDDPVPVRRDDPPAGPAGAGPARSRVLDPVRSGRRQAAGTRRHARRRTGAASSSRWPRRRRSPSDGIDAEVLDLRTLVPLDVAGMVESVRSHEARRGRAPTPSSSPGPSAEIAASLEHELLRSSSRRPSSGSARGSCRTPRRPSSSRRSTRTSTRIVAAVQRTLA